MLKRSQILNDFSVFSLEASYFKLIYEQKGINGAARKIGQDAANISRLLNRLEKKLGKKLFTRHKTGVSPTPPGEQLYQALKSAQDSFVNSVATESQQARSIRIGFSPTIGYSHFSPQLSKALIELSLQPLFTVAKSVELADLLKSREIDFVIAPNQLRFPGLISKKLGSENLVLCSRSGTLQDHIILNPDLIGLEKFIQSVTYKKRWMMKDYFVMAKMIENSPSLMAVLPEGLLAGHPKLKVIKTFPLEGNITALTWPGSIGTELLKWI